MHSVMLLMAMPNQAVEELNIKPKNWKDLLDDTPFTRKDIIHIQDPLNLQACPLPGPEANAPLGMVVVLVRSILDPCLQWAFGYISVSWIISCDGLDCSSA